MSLAIPPLRSGGLMLTYRCSCACRHCLYRCSPARPDEWIAPGMVDRVLEALAREPAFGELHLAGGEPTLRMDLLVDIIRKAVARGVPLSYVETNGGWCTDADAARQGMRRLKEAGLRSILVSVSMFHHEFVPFAFTRHAVRAAREVFGAGRTLVYLPHLYDLLERLPDDGTHTLDEFCRHTGIERRSPELLDLFGVIPGGRVPQGLRECYTAQPASAFGDCTCARELLRAEHVHVDPHGHLFTGGCAGIVVGTVEDFHPAITPERFPVFTALCQGGPVALMEREAVARGFKGDDRGYISKCDLCFQVRRHLHASGAYGELRPASFYGP